MIEKNHHEWENLYKSLKSLQEDTISIADFDLQKVLSDVKKYADNVSANRKDEYDEIIKKIQKVAKKIRDEGEEQKGRLDDFENKNLKSDIGGRLPDADFLFLNKEVDRYRSSLESMQTFKDGTLEAST